MRILITGARAPAALEWARVLLSCGHEVLLGDSVPWALSRFCRGVERFIRFPSPRWNSEAFRQRLQQTAIEERLDLIIPTCEEVFHLGSVADSVAVFASPMNVTRRLHGKFQFQQMVVEAALPASETVRLSAKNRAQHETAAWWWKPEFSRFAVKGGRGDLVKGAEIEQAPWIAQEHLCGVEWCCYAVCVRGEIVAFSSYRSRFRAGLGASVAFVQELLPSMTEWVSTFARHHSIHGQIAFDFIETSGGRILPLECNPRATSGIHLLSKTTGWTDAVLGAKSPAFATPCHGFSRMLALPMLLSPKKAGWAGVFRKSSDVVWSSSDPLPGLIGQAGSLGCFGALALAKGISLNEAFTWDIEWNG